MMSSTAGDLPSHPILGDAAALLSSAFYAVYVVFLKVKVGDETRADMQLMLGCVLGTSATLMVGSRDYSTLYF